MSGENPKPTGDLVFRKLFGSEENKDLLISLINSVVEPNLHLTDVVIKNPFNLAAYKDYSALNTTIGIHFLDFDFFDDDRMVRQFVFKDMETNEHPEQLKVLQLYFIEMGKFHKDWGEITTASDRWIAFMTKGEGLNRKSLPDTLQAEPAIAKAVAELERMGADPELREIYEAEEKARMVEVEELQYAEQKGERRGIEQGIEQGMQRGQQHLLLRLMTRHIGAVPPNIAFRIDTLTPSELEDLGEALFDLNSYAQVADWLARL